MAKLCSCLKKSAKALSNACLHMSALSVNILLIGQAVIFVYAVGLLSYCVTAWANLDGYAAHIAVMQGRLSIDCLLAALCILYGGALLTDYLQLTVNS